VVGGAAAMLGAPLLAARAALKLGAGSVHVGLLAEDAPSVDLLHAELMLHSASEAMNLPNVDIYAVGCGMGQGVVAQKLLRSALATNAPLVLDADALNMVARHADLRDKLRTRQTATVLTPHPGEAARLLHLTTSEVQANRFAALRMLAEKFDCDIVLKGSNSLCANPDGRIFINATGNPGMSSPGMGDVLTGMIAAFIAQGMHSTDALLLAVHLHGAAGDALAQQKATIGMTATEVTDWSRWLLNQWL